MEAVLKIPKSLQTKLLEIKLTKSTLSKTWPYIAVVVAHIIWGMTFVVTKFTLQEIPPMSLAFLRFTLAALLLLPFLLTDKKALKIDLKDLPKLIIIGVLMVTLNIGFFYAGLLHTTITTASVLTMIIPALSVLGGWWFLKEKIYTINLAGILLGLVGAVTIIGFPLIVSGTQISSQSLIGNFLIILASISWVAGGIFSKNMAKKYSTLTLTTVIFLVGFITFLIPAVNEYLQNPNWPLQITFFGIFGLLFIAVASSISAYFLFEWGLCKLGIVKADLFQYIEPLIAVLLGILIFSEKIQLTFILGALLIGIGVYWSTLAKPEHKHHKAHRI